MATNNVVNSRYLPLSGGTMTGNIAFNPTTGGLVGTAAADNASAGVVGEVISSTISFAGSSYTTSGTPQNLTSISLTAGDWDVWGNIYYNPASGTLPTILAAGISATSATLPDQSLYAITQTAFAAGTAPNAIIAPMLSININSTTTYYLVGSATFTVSTMQFAGSLFARRRR